MNMNFPQRSSSRLDRTRRFSANLETLNPRLSLVRGLAIIGSVLAALLLAGCAAPIGADRVTTQPSTLNTCRL